MPNHTEITPTENYMKRHFVRLMKEYSHELLVGPTAAEKNELANWLDLQLGILITENINQSLEQFISLILENCLLMFPSIFPALYSNTLLSLEYAESHNYLEMLNEQEHDITQLEQYVPVVKNTVKAFRTNYKNKQSTN